MTKKKKTNIFKKIILTLTACFIAVFSVFTLVDIPKETKQVSAATIADGDIVYNSPNISISTACFQHTLSDFNKNNIIQNNSFFNLSFVYEKGGLVNLSWSIDYFGYLFGSSSSNLALQGFNTKTIFSSSGINFTTSGSMNSFSFDPLYNCSFKADAFRYTDTGFSVPDTSYQFLYVNFSYSYNPSVPFAFDVLDIYINPMPTFGSNFPSGVGSSIVLVYHPIGYSSGLTFEFSYFNNQLLQGNDTLQTYYLNPNYESSGSGSSDPNAYQNGYDNGYSRGYIEGESSSQDSFFDRGYNEGYDSGKADGYLEGEQAGISQGNTSGYLRGKNDGYREGKEAALNDSDKYSFTSLITSVIDVPINSFRSMFNFEVLGVDLSGFFLGLLTCCIVITIVKMII